ncbi:N-acetylmuramic acid 6-phosphate etherase [Phytoactinopolyspora halotolerans]|uniref:N-acetylmuramic acid 6-phosphate etherase n=1 Tax=Phytoactinopolyspora halotolerans TaxID=1981512 RepID=A0A6L9SH93_9ACTN|nr:N-acetylmuramic acid 6-phosphate etherase [Phytoactinopolyspora halotolerans]NEE04735.1 N-acetylmuramic acid 6-phosphate etherase [Phytoactinopolyspora halotolerans]
MTRQGDHVRQPPTTERADPRFARIEEASIAELARQMNAADATVPAAVAGEVPRIARAIEAVVERMNRDGRLVYVGAGTSGRLGVLDASECRPTFNVSADQVFAIIAGGPQAVADAAEGAEDDAEAGARDIDDAGIGPDDTVIGLASSGRTPFVLGAARRARERGALTIGISCNRDAELSALVEHPIEVVVGPEVISGSTRLKAGTAQKMVLNMISTITMVKLGKTYRGLMVDVRPTNEKLRARATRIVCSLTDADPDVAAAMLADTGFDVPLAVLRLRLGLNQHAAADRLRAANGRLHLALGESA